jgi:hypothetical protein
MTDSLWLKFLRQYGPIARNDNMYDETIQRSARRAGVSPIEFNHPYYDELIKITKEPTTTPSSVILTGTAGDGKTHLCRQAWNELGGEGNKWDHDDPYLILCTGNRKVHFIRDLSAWAPQQGQEWTVGKAELLTRMCQGFFENIGNESFIIAANDGQLIESWRRLPTTENVDKARIAIETLLVEDRQELPNVRLKLLNLSRTCSTMLFDRALDAFISHSSWEELIRTTHGDNELFGTQCPIRHNYELLQLPLVKKRLRSLLELCNHNGLHVPIRQILLLLANALMGHPDVKDYLLCPADVPKIIAAGTVSKASLYNNVFGGNLPDLRRQAITIFDYFERFQIGYETSNRIDNLLIFGECDPLLGDYFEKLVAQDKFYGADHRFYASKHEYIEGIDEDDAKSQEFLQMLVSQRRGLFFKIPPEEENDLNLWELTVFKFAGEYLEEVATVLKNQRIVKRPIISRLVKGLNRIFTGMFINSDRELYLATSGNYSQARVSRILLDRLSVEPSKGEKLILRYDLATDRVLLTVYFKHDLFVEFNLTLIRYEFLSRISQEGSLPSSFSKECYEDMLAFKSQLIAACIKRQTIEGGPKTETIGLNILALTEQGMPDPKFVEIIP